MMRKTLLMLPAALLLGCSSASEVGSDPGPGDATDSSAQPDLAGCRVTANLDGAYFRALSLIIEKPAGNEGALAETLTMIWNPQLRSGLLVLMFRVTKHDLATGELVMEGGSGIRITEGKNAGRFQFLAHPAPNAIRLKVDDCVATVTEPAEIRIYPEYCTDSIPIKGLTVGLNLAPDGSAIGEGSWMKGSLCATNAKGIDTKFLPESEGCINFYGFINDIGVPTDSTAAACGEDPAAWAFEGRFHAPRMMDDEFLPGENSLIRSFKCF
ncbi:MAG: hypothetical protein FJ087_12770 [Deltaproteobacteria bacterium]|nr:hypothetical protein [Deltaproteobacteria bacterium]